MASASRLPARKTKWGLYHDDAQGLNRGWFMPIGGASSTYVVKAESINGLSCLETICMTAAKYCGISCAETGLFDSTDALVWSKRYDRTRAENGRTVRLHQEDFCQALGLPPSEKYAQLEPSTLEALGAFIRDRLSRPLDALSQIIRLVCFNYAVGNCDNHLKNISLLYGKKRRIRILRARLRYREHDVLLRASARAWALR